MGVFINCSNHRIENWSKKQLDCAQKYGHIIDYEFPDVDPNLTYEEVCALAKKIVDELLAYGPDVVMCQGEFTLVYQIVSLLKKHGIEVVAACSERVVVEKQFGDSVEKTAVFEFIGFRKY